MGSYVKISTINKEEMLGRNGRNGGVLVTTHKVGNTSDVEYVFNMFRWNEYLRENKLKGFRWSQPKKHGKDKTQ